MYTHDCKEPNCVKCKQVSEVSSSEEENQTKMMKAIEEWVASNNKNIDQVEGESDAIVRNRLLASTEKQRCLESSQLLREDIHRKITQLIDILREREQALYFQVERECYEQMNNIDQDVTDHCIAKILKHNIPEKAFSRTELVFNCELVDMICQLKSFGNLRKVYPEDLRKNWVPYKQSKTSEKPQEKYSSQIGESAELPNDPREQFRKSQERIQQLANLQPNSHSRQLKNLPHWVLHENEAFTEFVNRKSSDSPPCFSKATNSMSTDEVAKNSSLNKKFRMPWKSLKDQAQYLEDFVSMNEGVNASSSDDDDMEIISDIEAAGIPSDLPFPPSMPLQNRFKFARKRSCFSPLFSPKGNAKPIPSPETPESPTCNKVKYQNYVRLLKRFGVPFINKAEGKEFRPFTEEAHHESSNECLNNATSESADVAYINVMEPMPEIKEIPVQVKEKETPIQVQTKETSNEQVGQVSSSECLQASNEAVQDPSKALLSTFKKYLEKNHESEWLSPKKSSEQLLPDTISIGNCTWQSTRFKQDVVSDWLYSGPD